MLAIPVKSKTLRASDFSSPFEVADFSLLSFPPSLALLSLLWRFQRRKPPSTTRSIITSAKTLGSVNYFTSFLAHILSNISPPSSLSYTHIHTHVYASDGKLPHLDRESHELVARLVASLEIPSDALSRCELHTVRSFLDLWSLSPGKRAN